MSDLATVNKDTMVALEWLAAKCVMFDNVRYRHGMWSIRLFVDSPKQGAKPHHFAAERLTDAVDSALDHVIAERARIGIRGGD